MIQVSSNDCLYKAEVRVVSPYLKLAAHVRYSDLNLDRRVRSDIAVRDSTESTSNSKFKCVLPETSFKYLDY